MSESDTPASTTIYTPTTTAASSIISEKPHAKLSLAVRKNVRDGFETKRAELEAELVEIMGTPWKIDVDPTYLYTFASEDQSYARQNLGPMIKEYISSGIYRIRTWLSETGPPGQSELNRLATTHSITIDQTTNPEITYCGCDIANGQLRILFAKDHLGHNINDALADLQDAVNAASVAAAGPEGATELDFNAKRSIRDDYDAKIESVSNRIKKILALHVLTLVPNFETNFATITASETKAKKHRGEGALWDRAWQKHFGALTLQYFSEFADQLEYLGFGDDEMLQEGFREGVERGEIAVSVVERLERGTYNECKVEEGMVVLKTVPRYWGTNVGQAGEELLHLL